MMPPETIACQAPNHGDIHITHEIPAFFMEIELPTIIHRGHVLRESMHVNMAEASVRALKTLHPENLEKLLIEGRIIPASLWDTLLIHPDFQFYMSERFHRIVMPEHTDIHLILPQTISISPQDAQSKAMRKSTPASLADMIGYSVGWYKAIDIVSLSGKTYPIVEKLIAILGGINTFKIGTNDPACSLVALAKRKLTEAWLTEIDDLRYTGPAYVDADAKANTSVSIPLL